MDLFGRTARLLIFKEGEASAKTISDLRVTFEIEKNSSSNANTAKITVFNLNENSRKFVEREGLRMVLSVGYSGVTGLNPVIKNLFTGDIKRTATEKSGPDFLTTFETGDGESKIEDSHFDKSYAAKTDVKKIMREVVNSFGLNINEENIVDIESPKKFVHGVTLSGQTKKIMDDLTDKQGLEWNVQDEFIFVRTPDKIDQIQAVLLNKNTGLLNLPVKREKGIEFLSLLNTLLVPNKTVRIESRSLDQQIFDGFFNIRKSVFSGDTREGDWIVRCEAQ